MNVAYQGEPGAYSERAVLGAFPEAEPMPCDSVRLVFSRVTSGEAAFGVVPLENSQAGSVNETYDLLQHTTQCEEFLSSMRIEPVPVHDTAGAARLIAESGVRDEAAIASVDAAKNFGLSVLAERIQTEKENFTKFAVLGTGDPGLGAPDTTSLVWAVLDEPGSLLGALQPFADRGINLHKLESRPRRGKPFEYLMYVDVMAAADDPALREALAEVERHTSMVRVLGSYRSAGQPA
jgi:prephenate dehydratase